MNNYKNTIQALDKVFYEINGKNTFCKVKSNAFNIEKVQFAFVEFNTTTKKSNYSIDLYLSFDKALLFSNDILSGRIPKLAKSEKAKGDKYPKSVWQSPLGGTSEAEAKRRNLRSDGKAISRFFTLSPGSSQPYILTAVQQAGETLGNGLIKPIGQAEKAIRVPLDIDTLKSLALLIRTHINSYISAQYLPTGSYYKEFERNA